MLDDVWPRRVPPACRPTGISLFARLVYNLQDAKDIRTIGTLVPSGTTGRFSLKPEVQTPPKVMEAIAKALFPSTRVAPRVMWSALRLVAKVSAEDEPSGPAEEEDDGAGVFGRGGAPQPGPLPNELPIGV